jgi:hypothetical protein
MAAEIIAVKSRLDNGRCAIWEVSPEHPNGEVFVAGDKAVLAARTARVQAALGNRALVEVDKSEVPSDTPTPPAPFNDTTPGSDTTPANGGDVAGLSTSAGLVSASNASAVTKGGK